MGISEKGRGEIFATVSRERIIGAIRDALEPKSYALAFWEAGAASLHRLDDCSDIDLYVVTADKNVGATFETVERALRRVGSIDLRYRVPEPTPLGYSQCFYRLKGASPFLFIDLCVMKKSNKEKFLQYRIHGKPVVFFDKTGLVKEEPVNERTLARRMSDRLSQLRVLFPLFRVLVLKELRRGNDLEALGYYFGGPYRYLVEAIGMRYRPLHWDFSYRYLHYELPKEIVSKLVFVSYFPDAGALARRFAGVEKLFWKTVRGLDGNVIERKLRRIYAGHCAHPPENAK